jgi:APA family basic amino acid/polyamine antiporter
MDDARDRPRGRLGLFETSMLVMGGVVGAGIFMNPHVVAREAPGAAEVLAAWLLGGGVALAGGFVWAELAARRPDVGGQYAYLRDGIHPAVGFVYGWSNLLVVQTGGLAAVAMTFARYAHVLASPPWREGVTAAAAVALLTAINLVGVRAGGGTQSALMALKVLAIVGLIGFGLLAAPAAPAAAPPAPPGLRAFLAAMIAVLFAYGGWATATFASGDIRDPARTLPRALLWGMAGVAALYVGVNAACLHTLGVAGLAAHEAPASEVMRRALGPSGETAIAFAIALSTFGFLAQGIFATPRVYYAMARDGLFFASVGRLDPKSGVPSRAILLQCAGTVVVALTGTYEQILSWVVTVDFAFLAAAAATLFVFRRREPSVRPSVRAIGHPFTTIFFIGASLSVVTSTFVEHPIRSTIGWSLVAAGIPVYLWWSRRAA